MLTVFSPELKNLLVYVNRAYKDGAKYKQDIDKVIDILISKRVVDKIGILDNIDSSVKFILFNDPGLYSLDFWHLEEEYTAEQVCYTALSSET